MENMDRDARVMVLSRRSLRKLARMARMMGECAGKRVDITELDHIRPNTILALK